MKKYKSDKRVISKVSKGDKEDKDNENKSEK